MGGVSVTVTVTAGGGTLTAAPTTIQRWTNFRWHVAAWEYGGCEQRHGHSCRTDAARDLRYRKTGPPQRLFRHRSKSVGPRRFHLPVNPVAQVRDQFGNGVPEYAVTFTVIEGDGLARAERTDYNRCIGECDCRHSGRSERVTAPVAAGRARRAPSRRR